MNSTKQYVIKMKRSIDKGLVGNTTPGYPERNNLASQTQNIDSLICKMIYQYLKEETAFIADDENAIKVITKYLIEKKEEIKSIYKGLMLSLTNYEIALEYIEPKYSKTLEGYVNRKFSFKYNGKGTQTYSFVETNPDVEELTLKTLPFNQERLNNVMKYMKKIYTNVEKERTEGKAKRLVRVKETNESNA